MPALPNIFRQVQCAPDGNGHVLVEPWNNLNLWDTTDANWSQPNTVAIDTDAGLDGACIKLNPDGVATGMHARSKIWFDGTQPFAWKAKYRRIGTPEFNSFVGLQCGETHYYQARQDGFINTISPGQSNGYVAPMENSTALQPITNNTVDEFEVEYSPGNPSYFRYRKNGGLWARINGDKSYLQGGVTYNIPRFLGPFQPVFHMFSADGEQILSAGKLYISGTPMVGAADNSCWQGWDYDTDPDGTQQCARMAGYEQGPVDLGGLTRRAVYNPAHLPGDFPAGDDGKSRTSWLESVHLKGGDIEYNGVPPTGVFGATQRECWVPQDGYKYNRIILQRKLRAATSDFAKVFVYAANDAGGYAAGDLLSDAHVPGNSGGLVGASYFTGPNTLNTIQYVDVDIPVGVMVYFRAEGSTTGVDPAAYLAKELPDKQVDWNNQTKLQGVWLSFAEDAAYTWELPSSSSNVLNFDGTPGGTIKNFDGSEGGAIKDWP